MRCAVAKVRSGQRVDMGDGRTVIVLADPEPAVSVHWSGRIEVPVRYVVPTAHCVFDVYTVDPDLTVTVEADPAITGGGS